MTSLNDQFLTKTRYKIVTNPHVVKMGFVTLPRQFMVFEPTFNITVCVRALSGAISITIIRHQRA